VLYAELLEKTWKEKMDEWGKRPKGEGAARVVTRIYHSVGSIERGFRPTCEGAARVVTRIYHSVGSIERGFRPSCEGAARVDAAI
jgi:hypothetical protein